MTEKAPVFSKGELRLIQLFNDAFATVKNQLPKDTPTEGLMVSAFVRCAVEQAKHRDGYLFACYSSDDKFMAAGTHVEASTPLLVALVYQLSRLFRLDEELARGCCADFADIVERIVRSPEEGNIAH